MTLVIPPGFAQCAWIWTLEGDNEPMVSTCGLDVDSYGGDFTAAALAASNAWLDGFGTTGMAEGYTYRGTVLRVGQDGGPPVIAEHPTTILGGLVVDVPTQNVSVLVRKATTLGGRRGRGRMFLPPWALGEDGVAPNGVLAGGTRNLIQAGVDEWFSALVPVLLHEDTPLPVPVPTPITGFIVDITVATQRRRLRR